MESDAKLQDTTDQKNYEKDMAMRKILLTASRSSGTTKFSDGRLPLELGSDRRETSATRVSDDLQISIF